MAFWLTAHQTLLFLHRRCNCEAKSLATAPRYPYWTLREKLWIGKTRRHNPTFHPQAQIFAQEGGLVLFCKRRPFCLLLKEWFPYTKLCRIDLPHNSWLGKQLDKWISSLLGERVVWRSPRMCLNDTPPPHVNQSKSELKFTTLGLQREIKKCRAVNKLTWQRSPKCRFPVNVDVN